MVATRGSQNGRSWRLAPSLVALVEETDRLFPSRSIASDGSIGDPRHQQAGTRSDHNPDESGDVLAVDITDDKMHGCDADQLADWLISNRDPRIKYVIRNWEIAKSYATSGKPAWTWQPYSGPNGHAGHTHISIHDSPAAKQDTSRWWPQEDDMPLNATDLHNIQKALVALLESDPATDTALKKKFRGLDQKLDRIIKKIDA